MRDEFMIERHGKKYVLYAGLLDKAHEQGLEEIDTELVQVPTKENGMVAIVKAVAVMAETRAVDNVGAEEHAPLHKRKFSGIGDASPDNVGRNIAPHIIRMAETRAKARALRDAVNVGATSLEELGPEEGSTPPDSYRARGAATSNQRETRGGSQVARKSQKDLLRTLAEELRGENGVARLEARIGKPIEDLTRTEADDWIDRLTPAEEQPQEDGVPAG